MLAPVVTVVSTTSTTIYLSWTSSGREVDGYEVKWKRDISGICPFGDNGNATITEASNRYAIRYLEEDSNYFVTVIGFNAVGNATSVLVTGMTKEAGERLVSNNSIEK